MSYGKWIAYSSAAAVVSCLALYVFYDENADRPPSLQAIVRDLSSGIPRKQLYARSRLVDMGTNAVPQLLRMYGPPESVPRKTPGLYQRQRVPHLSQDKNHVLAAFAALGPDAASAVPVLMQDLKTLGYQGSRLFQTLGAIGEPALTPILTQLKTNSDSTMRRSCLSAIAAMGPPGERAIPMLTNLLNNSDNSTRTGVISALGGIARQPQTVVPLLALELSGTNEILRIESALAIARFGTNAAIALSELRTESETSNPRLKMAIASALAAAHDNENAATLAEAVLDEKDETPSWEARELLRQIELPSTTRLALIRRLAAHPSIEVNKTALQMLDKRGAAATDAQATEICFVLLKKSDREIQKDSVKILAHLIRGSDQAEEICKTVFGLQDGRLKRAFIHGMLEARFINLMAIKHALLDASPLVRQTALEVVPAIGTNARPILSEITIALEDDDYYVRMAAVRAVESVEHNGTAPVTRETPPQ